MGIIKFQRPLSYFLGTAAKYSILGTVITNSGSSSCNWDTGVYPGAYAGPAIAIGGTAQSDMLKVQKAMQDVQAAYEHFQSLTPTGTIAGDMIGRVLTPGIYYTGAAVNCTGAFTLDAQGDTGAVFIFQLNAGAYTPAAGGRTILINGASSSNVYWAVGGAISSGGTSNLVGTFISPGAITIGDGGRVDGRILGLGGVTLANNIILTT
jgi:hypothetical protein